MRRIFAAIVFLFCIVHDVDAYKTAADDPHRPFYIPADYIQIEAGDFRDYYEWWAESDDKGRHFVISQYNNKTIQSWQYDIPGFDYDHWRNAVQSIRRERRYTLVRGDSKAGPEQLYDLVVLLNDGPKWISVRRDANSTEIKPSEGSFFCKEWWIMNATHALDTTRLYEDGIKQLKDRNWTVLEGTYVRAIKDVQDSCLAEIPATEIQECFKGGIFCFMDEDVNPPKFMSSFEHVLQRHRGVDLIMDRFSDTQHTNMSYFVINFNGKYFYFPTTLHTFDEAGKPEKLHHRISLLPVLDNDNDAFWRRLGEFTTTPSPTTPKPAVPVPAYVPYPRIQIFMQAPRIYISRKDIPPAWLNSTFANISSLIPI